MWQLRKVAAKSNNLGQNNQKNFSNSLCIFQAFSYLFHISTVNNLGDVLGHYFMLNVKYDDDDYEPHTNVLYGLYLKQNISLYIDITVSITVYKKKITV